MHLLRTRLARVLIGASVLWAGASATADEDRLGDPLPEGATARLGTLQLRYGSIGDLAYLPDGRAMIALGPTLEIWNIESGERLFHERIAPASIRSLAVGRDGQTVMLADAAGAVHEWDPADNKIVRSLKTGQSGLLSAYYSPDGLRVLTTGAAPPTLKQFELASGRQLVSIEGEMHRFSQGIYDAAGKTAFVGGTSGSDPVLAHYDLQTGALLNAWHKDYTSYGHSPKLSPDGKRLLAGTRHMAVEFNTEDYKQLARFAGHHGYAVTAVAYCREPDQILTGSRDGSIRRWNRLSGEVLLRWVPHSDYCTCLRVSPEGNRVLSFGGGMVVESDLATGEPTIHWDRHSQAVTAVAMMPDAQRVLSGSWDATLRLWDVSSGKSLAVIDGAGLGACCVAAAPGGSVAAGCKDGAVREFSATDGSLLCELKGHLGYVRSVAYTPDGRRLISSGDDGRIRVWESAGDDAVHVLKEHLGGVLSVAVSADGQRLLSGGRDGTVRLWDLQTARPLHTLEGHRGWVETVCFARDGSHAFSSGGDGRILKWNLQSGEIECEMVHGGWVRAIACSPDGKVLCAGGEDKAITCWDLRCGTRLDRWRGHASDVLALTITPDSRRLVSASADTTLLVWELPVGG